MPTVSEKAGIRYADGETLRATPVPIAPAVDRILQIRTAVNEARRRMPFANGIKHPKKNDLRVRNDWMLLVLHVTLTRTGAVPLMFTLCPAASNR